MPEEYLVFVDRDEARDAWKQKKREWDKYVAAQYTKMIVKGGLAYAVNHFTLSIGGVIFEGPGIYKTDQHLQRLFEIRSGKASEIYACECIEVDKKEITCDEILLYTIEQKIKKYGRRIVAAVPGVGTAETVRAKIHGVTKTDRGAKRELYARTLHLKTRRCPRAQAIVAELLGSYRSQDSWKEMFSVCEWDVGWKVLKEKMAST
jgi:hypothetical protein